MRPEQAQLTVMPDTVRPTRDRRGSFLPISDGVKPDRALLVRAERAYGGGSPDTPGPPFSVSRASGAPRPTAGVLRLGRR